MTHCQLEKYVLDYSEVLSKKIGLSEFCDILGSTHIAAFQLLVDDIIDEESFRQYLSEDKERIADLRNSSKYILESRKEIVHEQQKLQRLKYSMQMAIHKDAVQKPDLGFDASSFIKTNGAYSSVFYLAALDAIGDKDRIKLYDDLIEALEEIEKKIAASDLELANVKKASELLKSLGREKETGAAIDNYFLGYDRNGRGFWYIPIKDTERIASTTVFGVLANDPQSPHDWFSIGGIADLVALFGSLSPHGIRECALRKALGQLHSKFGISLRNWDASAATAQVFMLDKSYKMFSDWLLESKIPSEEVQTYLEEDLCELSKTVDELFSTCKIEQHQTLDAVSLGNTCAIKYQLMICEELIQNPAIWTMLQDDTDTLTELKNISSLYRWCLKAMEKVKHELATQERERDEILKKEAMEIGRARARAEQEKEIPMEEVVSRSGRVIAMPLNWSAVIPPVTKVPSPSAKPAKVTLAKASKPDSGRRSSRLSNRVSVDEDSSPLEESSLSADENSSSSDFGAKGRKRSSRLATRRSSRDRSSTSRLDSGRKRKQKARLATRSKSVDNSQSSDTDSRIKRPTSGRLTRSRTATTVDDNSQSSDPEPSAKRPSSSRLTRSNKKVVDVSDEDKSEQSSSESSSVDDDHGISISKAPKNSIRVLVSNPRKGLIIEASSDEMTSRSESSDVDDAGSIHSEAVAPARTLRSRKMSLESASLEVWFF